MLHTKYGCAHACVDPYKLEKTQKEYKNDYKDFYHHVGGHEPGKKDFTETTREEFEKLIEGLIEETEQWMKWSINDKGDADRH